MRSTKGDGVVLIGEFFIDEILSGFNTLPKLGEEAFAARFQREVGGGAAITACGLAKLGVSVQVLGAVGREDGQIVRDRLSAYGVDTAGLETDPDELTGLTVSVSTREDRAFFSYYGANQRLPQVLRKPASLHRMAQARHVHFACAPDAELDIHTFAALRSKRRRVSIDVQSHREWLTKSDNLKILRHCDVFFPNEREAEWVCGDGSTQQLLQSFRGHGLRGVGMKMGGKGAALMWGKQEYVVGAYQADTVDTTGAGDCFNAGFIYAWLRGEPPLRCLETANICGALSTRALGGLTGFPSAQELESHLSRM